MPEIDNDVKEALQRFNEARDNRAFYEPRWFKNWKLARNYRDKTKYPYRSNVFLPMIFSIIQDQVPRFLEAAFSATPIVNAEPLDVLAMGNTRNVEDILTWDFKRAKVKVKSYSWVLQTLIYGTGVVKIPYRLETMGEGENKEITFDGPDFDVMDLFSFYWDAAATCDISPRYAIHRKIYPSMKDLKASSAVESYTDLDKITNVGLTENDFRQDLLSAVGMGYNQEVLKNAIEVLEIHDLVDNTIEALANRQIMIKRKMQNPFNRPLFVCIRNYPVPNEFPGMGEPEYLESMQHALNTKENQSIDNASIVNNQGLMYETGALANPAQNISAPGMKLEIAKGFIDKVAPMPWRDIALGDLLQEKTSLKNDMRMAAVGEHAISGPGQRKTATETAYIEQKETGRIGLKLEMFENVGLKEVAEIFLEERRKVIGAGYAIIKKDEVTNQNYPFVIHEEDLAGNFELQPMGSKVAATKKDKYDRAIERFKLFGNHPLIEQSELVKRTLQDTDEKDIESLMVKPELLGQGMPQEQGLGAVPQMGVQ